MREISTGVVNARRGGDHNLHLLDGLSLFGTADLGDLPDGLHPNAVGYARMGERFHRLAFSAGAPFAAELSQPPPHEGGARPAPRPTTPRASSLTPAAPNLRCR
jgi:hypothetical protein